MGNYRAHIAIVTRPQTFNPEEEAVTEMLHGLGFKNVQKVLMGTELSIMFSAPDLETAQTTAKNMAEKQHNPITKIYRVLSVEEVD